jgi:anti-anti-sigma regulatory factor
VTSRAEIRNRTCLVTMAGEFGRADVVALRGEIEWCLESATSVVFDLKEVTYANGAVMSLLHDVLERVGNGGWLGVARPLAHVERLFGTVGLTSLPNFRVFPTLDEALNLIDRS